MAAVEWRRRLREEAFRRAAEVASRVRGTVFLVGSFARGDFSEDSDVDLLIIGEFREPPHRRLLDVWAAGVEIIALTAAEAFNAVDKCYPIAEDVAIGVVLKDDLALAAELISRARKCSKTR